MVLCHWMIGARYFKTPYWSSAFGHQSPSDTASHPRTEAGITALWNLSDSTWVHVTGMFLVLIHLFANNNQTLVSACGWSV